MIVWAVVRNYAPPEINSLWASEVLARKAASALGPRWRVTVMTIGTE